jgi:hypothetical protein
VVRDRIEAAGVSGRRPGWLLDQLGHGAGPSASQTRPGTPSRSLTRDSRAGQRSECALLKDCARTRATLLPSSRESRCHDSTPELARAQSAALRRRIGKRVEP